MFSDSDDDSDSTETADLTPRANAADLSSLPRAPRSVNTSAPSLIVAPRASPVVVGPSSSSLAPVSDVSAHEILEPLSLATTNTTLSLSAPAAAVTATYSTSLPLRSTVSSYHPSASSHVVLSPAAASDNVLTLIEHSLTTTTTAAPAVPALHETLSRLRAQLRHAKGEFEEEKRRTRAFCRRLDAAEESLEQLQDENASLVAQERHWQRMARQYARQARNEHSRAELTEESVLELEDELRSLRRVHQLNSSAESAQALELQRRVDAQQAQLGELAARLQRCDEREESYETRLRLALQRIRRAEQQQWVVVAALTPSPPLSPVDNISPQSAAAAAATVIVRGSRVPVDAVSPTAVSPPLALASSPPEASSLTSHANRSVSAAASSAYGDSDDYRRIVAAAAAAAARHADADDGDDDDEDNATAWSSSGDHTGESDSVWSAEQAAQQDVAFYGQKRIVVTAVNGVNFPPQCNTFITLTVGAQRRVSRILLKADTDPRWNEPFVFDIPESHGSSDVPRLRIECWHKRSSDEESLGGSEIPLKNFHLLPITRLIELNKECNRALRIRMAIQDDVGAAPRPLDSQRLLERLALLSLRGKGLQRRLEPDVSTPTPLKQAANALPEPDLAQIAGRMLAGDEPPLLWTNRQNRTFLHLLSLTQYVMLVQVLLRRGAPLEARDCNGERALHLAARFGSAEVVRALLDAGAFVDPFDDDSNTPLHRAAARGSLEICRLLLAAGASTESKSNTKRLPIHRGAMYAPVVLLLLDHGSPHDPVDQHANTPCLLAELNGAHDVADLLLARGADANVVNALGDSLLWGALVRGDRARLKALAPRFPDALHRPLGAYKWTLLHRAVHELAHPQDVCPTLIMLGHPVDAKNDEGKTPLFMAAHGGSVEAVKLLLFAGANTMAVDRANNTPLHFASTAGVARLLLHDKNVRVNARNRQGNTPLHAVFAFHRTTEFVDLMLEHGADAQAQNKNGQRPADLFAATLPRKLSMPFLPADGEALLECGGLFIGTTATSEH